MRSTLRFLSSTKIWHGDHSWTNWIESLAFFAAIVSLSGCATYKPIPEGYAGPLATVSSTKQSLTSSKAYIFELISVDGRPVATSSGATASASYGQGLKLSTVSVSNKIPAGKVRLQLSGLVSVAAEIQRLFSESYSISGEVYVELGEGKDYFVTGELGEKYSAIWLEDNRGEIVSEVIESGDKTYSQATLHRKLPYLLSSHDIADSRQNLDQDFDPPFWSAYPGKEYVFRPNVSDDLRSMISNEVQKHFSPEEDATPATIDIIIVEAIQKVKFGVFIQDESAEVKLKIKLNNENFSFESDGSCERTDSTTMQPQARPMNDKFQEIFVCALHDALLNLVEKSELKE